MSKKVNVLRELLASKPVRVSLEFGIHDNVRLMAIDNEPRKRDGETIQKNTFLTFGKFNSKGEAIAKSEFSYFNLKHDNDWTGSNLSTQLAQLVNIISVVNPKGVAKFNPMSDYESMEELQEALKSKKGVQTIMKDMFDSFAKAVKGKIGPDSVLLRLKVVTDRKTGKYTQLPDDSTITESMDVTLEESALTLTAFEKRNKAKALSIQTEKADSSGSAPDIATSTSKILDI